MKETLFWVRFLLGRQSEDLVFLKVQSLSGTTLQRKELWIQERCIGIGQTD